MGSWGTSVFQDDVASDVRDHYNELLSLGFDDATIEREFDERYGSADGIDESTYWIALALCQHKVGRLIAAVRSRACACIESGRALADWQDLTEAGDPSVRSRERALSKALATLSAPQPARRSPRPSRELRTRIDRTYASFPWIANGLWAYRRTRGDYVVLAVSAVHEMKLARHYRTVPTGFAVAEIPELRQPCVLLLNYCGAALPTRADMDSASPFVASATAAAKADAAAAVDGIRQVWSEGATQTWEQFERESRALLERLSPQQFKTRYHEYVEHCAAELARYADREHAIARQFYRRYMIDPRETVPVDRIIDLGHARHFDCDNICVARGWSALDEELDAVQFGG
jgi:hypothetical protein